MIIMTSTNSCEIAVHALQTQRPTGRIIEATAPPTPWGQARIDYTFAQKHIESHHPHLNRYFGKDKRGIVVEDIFNARDGVFYVLEDKNIGVHVVAEPATLDNCGFELHDLASNYNVGIDWENPAQMRAFTEDLRRSILPKVFGGDGSILHCIFWNAFVRPEQPSASHEKRGTFLNSGSIARDKLPRLPPAATAHIDTDISGLMNDADRLINLLERNHVVNLEEFDDCVKEEMVKLIESGHRFVILNIWRPIGDAPIQPDPLGLLAVRYGSSSTAFPMEALDEKSSHWYFYPNMTWDECLLFKQYDRDARFSSDIWHCALSFLNENMEESLSSSSSLPPRRSIDVRAFVVLKEKVIVQNDRFQC